MDEYLCRTAFLYCGGRNGTFDKPFELPSCFIFSGVMEQAE